MKKSKPTYAELEKEIEVLKKRLTSCVDNEKFANYFDNNKACLLQVNSATKQIVRANNAAVSYYGYPEKDLLQMHIYDLQTMSPEDVDRKMSQAVKEPSNRFEFRQRMASGEIRDVLVFASPIKEGDTVFMIVTVFDITDQKKAQEKLNESMARLEEMNDTKDKLFSIIGHDLKSPFNAILGFSELLGEGISSNDDANSLEYLAMIDSTSTKTLMLLDNLLAWAKSQTGQIEFNPANLRLQEIILNVIEVLESSARLKNIKIANFHSDDHIVMADSNMLRTIIRNLIQNAIKFTNPGGRIDIYSTIDDGKVAVTVADNGIGIDPGSLENIFKPDCYFTTSGTANEGGSGLGLVLCSELVEKMGGKIHVESKPGIGTKFTISLPMGDIEKQENQQQFTSI